MVVDDEQQLFAAPSARPAAEQQPQGQWRVVEAPVMTLRELYSRFGGAPAPAPAPAPAAAAPAPAPVPAAPAPAPATVPTAQITVQQPGRASAKSVGWADVGAKGEAQADVEAGASPPPTGGSSGKAALGGQPAAQPLSKKMKVG